MRPVTKTRLESLSALQRRPFWQIVDTALHLYIGTLPEADRRALERPAIAAPPGDPDKQWVSLAEFIGSGEYGGSSMSRLSTTQIAAAAKKRGINPAAYFDGTRAGRNRLELAIKHRCEVLDALARDEIVPDVALEAYPDLASPKQRMPDRSPIPRRFPDRTSDR